jgi:hypothetical protein
MSSILGILVFVVDTKWIPKIIIDLYSYGKSCEGKVFGSSIRTILIPKRYEVTTADSFTIKIKIYFNLL